MALKYKVIRCVAYTIEIILLFILQELPYLMPSLLAVSYTHLTLPTN